MRAQRSVALLIFACSALAVTTGARAQTTPNAVVEAPRQVTGDGNPMRLNDIPALAVDPRDPDTVVMAVGDSRNGGCGLRLSRDAGLSWALTAPNLLPDPTGYCIQKALGPVMAPAFGSDGTLSVAMPFSKPATDFSAGPIDLVVARTNDLGATHETVTVAKSNVVTVNPADYGGQGAAQQGNEWNKFPSLVVDPKNPKRLYLGWRWYVWGLNLQSLPGDIPFRPYFATSDDGGRTWSKPVDILAVSKGAPVYGASAPMLVVAPDGAIYGFSKGTAQVAGAGHDQPQPARAHVPVDRRRAHLGHQRRQRRRPQPPGQPRSRGRPRERQPLRRVRSGPAPHARRLSPARPAKGVRDHLNRRRRHLEQAGQAR